MSLYFDNTPDSLMDDSVEAKLRNTLRQMETERDRILKEVVSEMEHWQNRAGDYLLRLEWAKKKPENAHFNMLGEFQGNPGRADVLLVQWQMLTEIIQQIRFVLNIPKESNEERPPSTGVRKATGTRPARRKRPSE